MEEVKGYTLPDGWRDMSAPTLAIAMLPLNPGLGEKAIGVAMDLVGIPYDVEDEHQTGS